jgi:nitroalkane oxidase
MPVDFHLSSAEEGVRKAAAAFAAGPLKAARDSYMKYQQYPERFQSTRSMYHEAVAGGLIKGQISPHLGGTAGTLVEATILVEEMYTVEPAASLTIFSTGLGLIPMNLASKPEHKEFLDPFLSGEGEPLASLVFSEPGGVANYLEKGAPGLVTTATLDGEEWVLNGEKVWTMLVSKRFYASQLFFHAANSNHRSGLPIALVGILKVQTFNALSAVPQTPLLTSLPMRF